MQKIHFYKGTELVYSVYANSIEEVKGNPELYYSDYQNNMIISEVEYNYPIVENNNLREMTRDELVKNEIEVTLNVGEVIKNKKLIKIDKPSIYHQWNGKEWFVDLEEVKKNKLEELKNIRDNLINSDLDMNGDLFQVRDTEDRDKFNRILLGLLLKKLKKDDTEEWRLANNTYKVFTYAELSNILDLYSARERELFKKFHQLDDKLQACNSIDEIIALKWE